MSCRLYDLTPLEPLLERGYVILTPTVRLARQIKAEGDRAKLATGARAWPALPIQPLERWLVTQWELAVGLGLLPARTLIDKPRALELWRQVIEEEEVAGGGYHLLRPAAAAELAERARENLLRWEVDLGLPATRQAFGFDVDCAAFLEWRDRFEQRLERAGLCTPADGIAALRSVPAGLPRSRVALVEFDDIPPLFSAVLEALCDDVQRVEVAGEEGPRLAQAFSGRRAELQAVACWAARTSREEPAATVGVVLADMESDRAPLEYLMRREFGCLGENYNALPVNFSTGIPLQRAPVVRDALEVLAMGLQETSVEAALRLLQSRFLALPDADTPAARRFVVRLFDDGREHLSTGELRYAASDAALGEGSGLALGRYLVEMSGMRQLRRSAAPSEWAQRFPSVLEIWGWPGAGPLDSLEYQQVELWYRTLEEFKAFDGVCGALDYAAALSLLRTACGRQISQPWTADSRVQVLGPLEAAGLRFDHLWLCGFQASSWPAPARPDPFIPLSLQRRLGLPHATADREWRFCETLMGRFRRSATRLRASYSRELEGVPELPSALLADFSWESVEEPPPVDPRWTQRWGGSELERLTDDAGPAVTGVQLEQLGGGSGLLEDQSHCPFRAFARHRLGVEPLGDFTLAQSAAARGSLLHDALFALWGEIEDHAALCDLDAAEEERAVERAVDAALEAVPGHRRRALGAAYWELEAARLAGLLREWLAVERQRGDFVVAAREHEVTLALGQLQIRLRLDRIDELPGGARMIIDYKSGRSSLADWRGERPARPQLLLYGLAAPENTAALAVAQVRPRESRFVGLGSIAAAPGIMPVEEWETLNGQWRERLEHLAAEFLAGEAAVDPLSPASCTWCGLQPLCRVGQAEAGEP